MSDTFEGGCRCGKIRYRMADAPIIVNCCHCRECQRITGSAFALNAMIETDRIDVLNEAQPEMLRTGESREWRCPDCATLLWADHRLAGDGFRFLRIGTLDAGERLAPDAHFFVSRKHPWIAIPPGVPAHATLPDDHGFGATLSAAKMARFTEAKTQSGADTSRD